MEIVMKTLVFSGSSDDAFGDTSPRGDDYDNCGSGEPIEWLIESKSENDAILIVGQYCPGAASGWLIGAARVSEDDDKPAPNWPMRIRQGERTYTPALEIDVPDDATISCLQRDDDHGCNPDHHD